MQTALSELIRGTDDGRRAESILRKCVHCGFCTATCPTYQLLGDELDGPRGRIYLMKQMLEGGTVTTRTQLRLDRCLTCRACETTCPSGVEYGHLLDIGRRLVEERVPRTAADRWTRRLLRQIVPWPGRFRWLATAGNAVRPVLPRVLRGKVPPLPRRQPRPAVRHSRRVLILEGCVQSVSAPNINAAAARLLDAIGISAVSVPGAGCCGALSLHLAARDEARGFMRRNIDAWWSHIDAGAEAIVSTASGCGVTLEEYSDVLSEDPQYAEKARRVADLTRDLSELIEPGAPLRPALSGVARVAFQSPCTLQHGMRIRGRVEAILLAAGHELTVVPDSHLCCGSAGTYSVLQPAISTQLRDRKIGDLLSGGPQVIATANIGCLLHLAPATDIPVRHWVELVSAAELAGSG